jgi:YHS domain-containing protein
MAKDLVCNMDVDRKTAKWKTTYKGKTIIFVRLDAKKSLKKTPKSMWAANLDAAHELIKIFFFSLCFLIQPQKPEF